eukprot:TRINITY_DN9454_c0_g1_i1.p1 TRINITY_DN9454_c0_g1~~TRINITY_DN9454_c0_g1_i1.p1  ORF type:complete len:384 (+),score=102.28 TRINITY_DN9454_c0_g1_i1:89-1240(+)
MVQQWVYFTPIQSLFGGIAIGSSVFHCLFLNGAVLGCSGIFHSVITQLIDVLFKTPFWIPADRRESAWKWASFAGFLVVGLVFKLAEGWFGSKLGVQLFDSKYDENLWLVLGAGLSVGLGTKLANGCTSGHMLAGFSRLSPRSLLATMVFFPVAVLVANFARTIPTRDVSQTSTIASITTEVPSWATLVLLTVIPFLLYGIIARFLGQNWWGRKALLGFLFGVHFAIGLTLSGMTKPSKVLSFFAFPLHFYPFNADTQWDLSLAMVIVGGLIPNMVLWQFHLKRNQKTAYGDSLDLPTKTQLLDWRLIVGSILFGVGWGLSGICPGPAMVNFINQWKFFLMMALGGQIIERTGVANIEFGKKDELTGSINNGTKQGYQAIDQN